MVERGFRFLKDPQEHLLEASGAGDEAGDGHGGGPVGLRPGGMGAQAKALGEPGQPTGLVVLEGRPWVLNLTPYHETAARLLGVERYYLLE